MIYPKGNSAFHPRTYILGAQARYAGHVSLSGHVLSFGIFFRPFALWQLFGIPPAELANVDGDATAVMGSWVVELWHKLACARSFSNRITVATDCLLRVVRAGRPLTSIMSTAHLLLPSDETARVIDVAHRSAMSIRSYERQFAIEIGMTPKQFARIARFARAIDLKRKSNDSWLNIAHDLGYFDQMHMVRDFRILGGDAPGRLVHPNSDFQPWSVQTALE
jgi:AraC-like DNA-binding protein